MDIESIEKKNLKRKQLAVGSLFIIALFLSVLFAYWMGAIGLNATKEIHITYDFAGGLQKGSPVRLGGIKVGRVSEIGFVKNSPGKIRATLKIESQALDQITTDSKFYINLAGLIGERYIEIVSGTGDKISSGTEIAGVNPPRIDQLFSQGYGIFGDIREFYAENKTDIKETLESLRGLSVSLNKLMGSSSPEQRKNVQKLFSNLADMSGDLKTTTAQLSKALTYLEANRASETWEGFADSIAKIRQIERNDIRRLMLEDGMKVNFSKTKIPEELIEKKKQ